MPAFSFSKGFSQYGAQMGRREDFQPAEGERVRLQRVRLDSGGYDPGGAYWGIPSNLWAAEDRDGGRRYLRAESRDQAKVKLLAEFRSLKFFGKVAK